MQITMSMEEYEDLKYESKEEIRKLELENRLLKEKNEELRARLQIYEKTLYGIDAAHNCGNPPKSAKKGGFLF